MIARSDARAVVGFDEAIARANEALAAGAGVAFVEAAHSLEEIAKIPRPVNGLFMLNRVSCGKPPAVGVDQAEAMGYRMAILPGILFRNAIATFDRMLADLKQQQRAAPALAR